MHQQETRGTQSFSLGNADVRVPFPPVRITPNRHSIDNRFPILGFTIATGDLPYFEVLLTIDRSLFAPQNAGRRNAGNFYASRQDSGLIHTTGSESIYLVPPAVFRSFAQHQPRPESIFYTLVAYRDASGSGPVFAHRPEELPTAAPSVTVSGDFTGQTLAAVLGIPADKLKYVTASKPMQPGELSDRRGYGHNGYTASYEQQGMLTDPATPMDYQSDEGEGEDGYIGTGAGAQSEVRDDTHPVWSRPSSDETPPYFSAAPRELYPQTTDDRFTAYRKNGHRNGYHNGAASDASRTASHNHAHNEFVYEDGYEESGTMPDVSAAQESIFPVGAAEPEPLSDDEQPYGEDFGNGDELYAEDESALETLFRAEAVAQDATDDASATFAGDAEVDDGRTALPPYEALSDSGVSLPHDDGNYESYDDGEPESNEYDEQAGYDTEYEADEDEFAYQSLDDGGPAHRIAPPARQPLSIDVKRRIVERIARFESGRDSYSAINPDGEFEGRFGTDHPAYQRYHIGLSYGAVQFTQDSGLLGRLLTMMRDRDPQTFADIFGQQADELLRVTTAAGPPSRRVQGGRSARVQPVAGADLWREPWVSRFRRAGQHIPFQAAQNELASIAFLDPMLQFAGWLGLDTDRALAMVVDRAVQLGRGGAQRWSIAAVGPVQTVAQQQQVLAALGMSDLRAFQRTRNLEADGEFTPLTHAAMVAALRDVGARSPLPIPTREQMLDAMVRHAAGRRWAQRLQQLRQAADFTDTPYQL